MCAPLSRYGIHHENIKYVAAAAAALMDVPTRDGIVATLRVRYPFEHFITFCTRRAMCNVGAK